MPNSLQLARIIVREIEKISALVNSREFEILLKSDDTDDKSKAWRAIFPAINVFRELKKIKPEASSGYDELHQKLRKIVSEPSSAQETLCTLKLNSLDLLRSAEVGKRSGVSSLCRHS